MNAKIWKVRPYAKGDETQILNLFEIVFGGKESQSHWNWLFPGNPFSRPIVYLAETAEGRIVGHYCLIPTPFRKHHRRTLAALSIQSMIHPDFQRQGILKALASAAESQLNADGVEMGITFLNDNSLHAYTQHFGWTELQDGCAIQFAVIDSFGPIRKVLKVGALARLLAPFVNAVNSLLSPGRSTRMEALEIRPVKKFSADVNQLWKLFSAKFPNTVERSAAYLNWRLAEKPDSYSLYEAKYRGELVGVLATKVEQKFGLKFGYVVELFHHPAHPVVAESLAAFALRSLGEAGCSMATALCLGPLSLKLAFDRCGFWKLPKAAMPHGIHFCFKDRADHSSASFLERRSWFLSWSDHDVV